MEGGITNDDLVQHVENDEICDGVETTDLADERILNPKSTSNTNENVISFLAFICLVHIRPKRFSEKSLPYFTLLFLLSLPKLKRQPRIKLLF